jgi:uncharacterized membrane protein
MIRARIAGHPVHPFFAHFPIAFWYFAVFWDIVGYFKPDPLWYQMSYWSLAAGLFVALLTAVTGFLEYVILPPEKTVMQKATAHMMLMLMGTALFGGSWIARAMSGAATPPSLLAFAFALIGIVVMQIGGWLGGMLVYKHGIGRAET